MPELGRISKANILVDLLKGKATSKLGGNLHHGGCMRGKKRSMDVLDLDDAAARLPRNYSRETLLSLLAR